MAEAQDTECPNENGDRCLVIVKDTNPETSGEEFDFEHEHASSSDDFTLEDDESVVFLFEDTDPHVVAEDVPDGWVLADIDCSDSTGVDIDVDKENAQVTVTMNVGEAAAASATCIFVNEREPTVTPTATQTATATQTVAPTTTSTPTVPTATATTPASTATSTTVPSTVVPTGVIQPPSTGSAGLK